MRCPRGQHCLTEEGLLRIFQNQSLLFGTSQQVRFSGSQEEEGKTREVISYLIGQTT